MKIRANQSSLNALVMTRMSKSRAQSCVFKRSKLVRTGVLLHDLKENRFATDHEI